MGRKVEKERESTSLGGNWKICTGFLCSNLCFGWMEKYMNMDFPWIDIRYMKNG